MEQPSDIIEGERRWAAVLFADMAAFTSASEALGAERVYHLVRKIIPLANASIESHGGQVLEYAGDSILAIFGAPIALENASLKACEAALALQRVISAEVGSFTREFSIAPRFRVGIGGGEVVLGHMGLERKLDLKVTGEPVNLAARLQTLAGEGEIWISDSVFQQVEGFVDATSLGQRQVKGLNRPQQIYRIDGLSRRETKFAGLQRRGTVPLVGRGPELERLEAAAQRAAAGLQVITVSGSPGIGKSRLAHELLAHGNFNAVAQVVQCSPQSSGIALKPFIDVLSAAAAIDDADTPAARRSKLDDLLARVGLGDEGRHTLLCDLMDQSAPAARGPREDDYQRAADTRDLLCEIIAAACRQSPWLMVIEDAHWIDHVTDELIQATITKCADARLAIVITHRPNYAPAWLRSPLVTSIPLQPLSSDATNAMIASHLGADQVPDELAALVDSQAEGNPLFVEETLRFLRASGQIAFSGDGIRFSPSRSGRVVPGNLQHLIMSRVDALPADQRSLLQLASVFGRRFFSDDLERVTRSEGPVSAAISGFVLHELVEPDPGLGEKGFRFKHALIRDALYDSILSTNRRAMHERIARDLEMSAAGRLGEVAEFLAYHYAEAQATEKAVEYLWQSAVKSMKVYSISEADRQLREIVRLVSSRADVVTDERFGDIASAWLRVADQSGNWTRVREVAAQVLPRLRAAGPSTALSQALTYLALAHTHLRDYRKAHELADEARLLAERMGDPLALAWSKTAHMRIYEETNWKGRDALIQLADEIVPVAETCNDAHLGLTVRFVLASSFQSQGLCRRAREAAGELLRFGELHRDRRALGYGRWLLSRIAYIEENFQEALAHADACLAVAMPNTSDDKVGKAFRAASLIRLGELKKGMAEISRCEADLQKKSDIGLLHTVRFFRGVGEMMQGRIAEGKRTIKANSTEVQRCDNLLLRYLDKLFRAGMLLSIGLGGEGKASPNKLALRDLVLVLCVKPFALGWAERLLKECQACPLWQDGGVFQAQVQLGLGRIHKARRRIDLARQCLQTAKRYAEAEGAPAIAKRADEALAGLY
jgi:class 3 adenylate cyclase/tetratricopeptide (TPR) repeat protein